MIQYEILREAGIDYEACLARFLQDADLYETILVAFLAEDVLERAEHAYAVGDAVQLFQAVHEAKGVCGNAGCDALYQETSALVERLRGKTVVGDTLAEDFSHFAESYRYARSVIQRALI